MRTIIIQARLGSSRLPGKVLKHVNDKPLLGYLVEQLQLVNKVSKIVVATTDKNSDDLINDFCIQNGIDCFRGSEEDVLGRIYMAASKYKSNPIMRITADCPLIDPNILSRQFDIFDQKNLDYCYLDLSYPEGICADLFNFKILEAANFNASHKDEREHVTPYMHNNKSKYQIEPIQNEKDESKYRFVVDTSEDFKVVSKIIEHFTLKKITFNRSNIIDFLNSNPEIQALNSCVKRNESYSVFD